MKAVCDKKGNSVYKFLMPFRSLKADIRLYCRGLTHHELLSIKSYRSLVFY